MKLAIIGSRTFSDYPTLEATMANWFGRYEEAGPYSIVTEIISGGANGIAKRLKKPNFIVYF